MQLVVSADDFGASDEVNVAVEAACRDGVLTSASLMVTGEAVYEAVAIARDSPLLSVGLHLTLSNGRSALAPRCIPDLVNTNACFAHNPAQAALRYCFSSRAKRQLRLEIEAQFEGFSETGLEMGHVDGHQHLHAHPAVLPMVIELATQYGARGIRVPRDPLRPNLHADRSGLGTKAVVALGHAYLKRCCDKLIKQNGLVTCETVIGSLMSGRMTADYVISMLNQLDCKSAEVFFHPSTAEKGEPFGPNRGDLNALLDVRLKGYIEQSGCVLTSYAALAKEEETRDLG